MNPHGRDDGKVVQLSDRRKDDRPVPISTKIAEHEGRILECTTAELVEAAERVDAGDRVETPQLVAARDPRFPALPTQETEALLSVHSQIASHVRQLQSDLAYLQGAVERETLAAAVVGAMGNAAEEIREQLRPLREALTEQGDSAA